MQSFETKIEYPREVVAAAEKAAAQSLPQTYVIASASSARAGKEEEGEEEIKVNPLRFITFGCHGNGKIAQKEVAELVARISKDKEHRPDFIILLGDNFYDFGIDSCDASAVDECFNAIYGDLKKLNIPIFVISGNHDLNYHKISAELSKVLPEKLLPEKGIKRVLHEVAISYLPDMNYPSVSDKVKLYNTQALDPAKLPLWNMPHRFYSIVNGDTEIFFLDSSSYVREYYEYMKDPENTPITNQAKWLESRKKDCEAHHRKAIAAMHHPLFTAGKRAYDENDYKHYFEKPLRTKIREFFKFSKDDHIAYHQLIRECFKRQKLFFDLFLNAHDHCMYYYNNTLQNNNNVDYPICELVAGGGGGGLQHRIHFADKDMLAFFLRNWGCAEIVRDNQGFSMIIRTSDRKYEFQFNISSLTPVNLYPRGMSEDEIKAIKRFNKTIKKGIDDYFEFLNENQTESKGAYFSLKPGKGNVTHGHKGIEQAHNAWAELNQLRLPDFATLARNVYEIVRWDQGFVHTHFTNPTKNSLISKINNAIKVEYPERGKDFDLARLVDETKKTSVRLNPSKSISPEFIQV